MPTEIDAPQIYRGRRRGTMGEWFALAMNLPAGKALRIDIAETKCKSIDSLRSSLSGFATSNGLRDKFAVSANRDDPTGVFLVPRGPK